MMGQGKFYKRSDSRWAVENWPISKPTVIATVVANLILLVFGMFGGELKDSISLAWKGFSDVVVVGYFLKSGGEHLINVSAQKEVDKEVCADEGAVGTSSDRGTDDRPGSNGISPR